MSKTAIVYTCAHAKPEVNNDRAVWLGKLIYDVRPDYVVDLGDKWEMNSLSSYDTRYPQKMVLKSYEKDIDSGNDFNEKVKWQFVKNNRKQPTWYGFMGNHEERLLRALALDPQLEGDRHGISLKHFELSRWYNEYYPYEYGGPALREIDKVTYGHYLSSGAYGRAMGGDHHAFNMLKKRASSISVGHSHKLDYKIKLDAYPHPIAALVAGCFKGEKESWAGQANDEWWSGVVIKRNIDNGSYDPQFVSLKALEKTYGE